MAIKKNAADTSCLPQYALSEAFMERFLDAAHDKDASIVRSANSEAFKLVDASELELDFLRYFFDNQDAFRAEFTSDVLESVPIGAFNDFCDVLRTEWIDGKGKRNSGRCLRLKRSIHEYLISSDDYCAEFAPPADTVDVEPLISVEELSAILTVNNYMIVRHIEAWKQNHPNHDLISDSDIFLRRGLSVSESFNKEQYVEHDFLSSYSLAFSVPEKFTQIARETPALINGELTLFVDRVLFFSPFIPRMKSAQLEFGVIPSSKPLPLYHQGSHGGVDEYILDPAPFHK
ncbi:hypothetical protein [Pseudomonas sp. RIT-PI-o]|uniref:hypothetical protein n=1 Tax=Pseudomonas sp. RIT-PI-o TaxID=1690246 RepID=UPI0006CCB59E|nr:hypothetical protein [Pseudomonas sp. RIT-PI-o]KPG85097.1 hypothetical protein AEQ63_04505 [Pseudomonas sp. RIT-PI-o]